MFVDLADLERFPPSTVPEEVAARYAPAPPARWPREIRRTLSLLAPPPGWRACRGPEA